MFANMLLGLENATSITNLFYCFVGVSVGTFIGVLPGIGPLAAVSVLMPLTFYMEPMAALVMIAGIYYGAEYGGSTASILLNLPGTAANAVTCLDGYPMALQGRAAVALFVTTIASFAGGVGGILVLTLFTPAIAEIALSLKATEYVAIMVLGLISAGVVTQGSPLKGLVMIVLGLLLSTVGIDLQTGASRYSFGTFVLYDGISVVIIAMGLFGIAEMIGAIRGKSPSLATQAVSMRSMLPRRDEVKLLGGPALRGGIIGTFVGALPGAGVTLAAFMAYAFEKKISKDPNKFGKGAIEGITAPESANNAAAQTAFIPTLSLGIPGSPTMALLLGAMMIHGITPGPLFISEKPEIFWGLIASFWIGNILLLILNIPLIGIWVWVLRVPYQALYLFIFPLICVGVFSLRNEVFDVVTVLVVGVFGYFLRQFKFEPAPLMISFVLGPMLEENFRRAVLIGRGEISYFFNSTLSSTLLILTLLIALWAIFAPALKRHM